MSANWSKARSVKTVSQESILCINITIEPPTLTCCSPIRIWLQVNRRGSHCCRRSVMPWEWFRITWPSQNTRSNSSPAQTFSFWNFPKSGCSSAISSLPMPMSPISDVRSPCHTRTLAPSYPSCTCSLYPPTSSGKVAPDIEALGLNFNAEALYPPGAMQRSRICPGSGRLITPRASCISFPIRCISWKNPRPAFTSVLSAFCRCFWKNLSPDVLLQPWESNFALVSQCYANYQIAAGFCDSRDIFEGIIGHAKLTSACTLANSRNIAECEHNQARMFSDGDSGALLAPWTEDAGVASIVAIELLLFFVNYGEESAFWERWCFVPSASIFLQF